MTVKALWGGAIAAVRDVAQANPALFLADGVASSTGLGHFVAVPTTVTGEQVAPDISFADSTQALDDLQDSGIGREFPAAGGRCPVRFSEKPGRPRRDYEHHAPAVQLAFRQRLRSGVPMDGQRRRHHAHLGLWARPIRGHPSAGTVGNRLRDDHPRDPIRTSSGTNTGSGVTAAITQIQQYPDAGVVGGISLNNGNNGESSAGPQADYLRYLSSSVTDSYGLFTSQPAGFITYLAENDAARAVWGIGSAVGYN